MRTILIYRRRAIRDDVPEVSGMLPIVLLNQDNGMQLTVRRRAEQ